MNQIAVYWRGCKRTTFLLGLITVLVAAVSCYYLRVPFFTKPPEYEPKSQFCVDLIFIKDHHFDFDICNITTHRCEQLAQGCYAVLSRCELNPRPIDCNSSTLLLRVMFQEPGQHWSIAPSLLPVHVCGTIYHFISMTANWHFSSFAGYWKSTCLADDLAMQSAVIPTAITSVCPSHAGTLSRRMNVRSCGLHCEVAKTL